MKDTMLTRFFFFLVFLFICSLITTTPLRADTSRGKLLYKNHCIHCHTSGVHIRKKRKAQNLGDIHYQVNRWVKNNKLKWDEQEIKDVVKYLNATYYHYSE